MKEESDKKGKDCMMECPDCHHKMNVCRSRIISRDDPVCPGCGAELVPLVDSTEK